MRKFYRILLFALLGASAAVAQTGTGTGGGGEQSRSSVETSAHGKKTAKTSKAHKGGKKSKSATTQQPSK